MHMDAAFVLLAGLVLIFPIIAVVALVKAGKVRDLLDQSITAHDRELAYLRTELERVQRELKQLIERMGKPAATPVVAPLAVAAESEKPAREPAPEPKPAPIETPAILVPPPVVVAAAEATRAVVAPTPAPSAPPPPPAFTP